MKVLYIYSGTRSDKFKGKAGVDYPDTQFYGLNHLGDFGIDAEFKEAKDVPVLRNLERFLPFSIKHAFLTLYFSLKGDYDIIFGSSLLYGIIFKKVFGLKQKFILLDISLGRTLTANKKGSIKSRLVYWLLTSLDAAVTLSEFQKEKLDHVMSPVFSVHLGVDTTYHKANFTGRDSFILAAGRDNGRDYKTVFEVAELLPERQFRVICSERNLVDAGPIPANVEVHFDVPLTKWYEYFHSARLLLLITHDDTYTDGSDCSGQTALLDAMATGLPVLVSRKKYVAEYVADQKDAFVVNCYDSVGIVDTVSSVTSDKLISVAQQARMIVEERFSTKKMAQELAIIFKHIHSHGSSTQNSR